jgi:hypothetical protein
MKKLIGFSLALVLAHAGHAAGQQAEPAQPGILEAYGCTFRGANDLDDFLDVAGRWNDWADDRNVTDYTALVLTPYFYSADLPYEVIWLGVWPNGAAMGEGVAQWFAEGQRLNAQFQEVTDCSMHQLAAALPIRTPEGGPPDGGLISFSDCSLEEGRTVLEALGALREGAEYLEGKGNDLAHGVLFPLAGEVPDASYDFKAVTGFSSPQAHGQFLDTILTPEAIQMGESLMDGLLSCDSSRIYAMNLIRAAAPE